MRPAATSWLARNQGKGPIPKPDAIASRKKKSLLAVRPFIASFSRPLGDRPSELVTKRDDSRRPKPESPDPLEVALATAIVATSDAGRFDVVAQLATELEARRLARESNVVALASRKTNR
jgi:hypothetical protein